MTIAAAVTSRFRQASAQLGRLGKAIFRPAVLTAVFTALAAFAGGYASYLGKDRELDIRMVEIGLSILRGQTEDERAEPARQFAIEALKQYSGLDKDSIEWHRWMEVGTVPFETLSGDGNWSDFLLSGRRLALLGQLEDAPSEEERARLIAELRRLESGSSK